MRKRSAIFLFFTILSSSTLFSQAPGTEVFLLTCSPGTESYSMYGHSALRVVDAESGVDQVYNWGVFDFSTPNFNYKFARGKLDYMLGVYPYRRFLQEYFSEERSVYMQRINLSDNEVFELKKFLTNNMKDENRYYRYDFFMDNCATRIRDIFELILGEDLVYPQEDGLESPSYRDRLNEYQQGKLWLDVGMDLLLGTPSDEVCDFRGSMFLPDYLMSNLSEAEIQRDNNSVKLLGTVQTVFEFDMMEPDTSLKKQPWFFLSLFVIAVLFFTFRVKSKPGQGIFDQLFFTIMFILAFLMIFTNYLTDHEAMGSNYNMVWLNPLILFTPFIIFFKNKFNWLWSLNIALSLVFMILTIFIKQAVNPAFIPIILILIIRSYYRLNLYRE